MRYMKWIPVEHRLPDDELRVYRDKYPYEESVEVIVLIRDAVMPTTLEYDGTNFISHDGIAYPVSHWMELPPTPDECTINLDLGDQIEADYEALEAIFV